MNAPMTAISTGNQDVDELLLAPSLERRRLQCYLTLVLTDIAAIIVGYWAVGYLYLGNVGNEIVTTQTTLALPIFLTIALYNNAYSTSSLQNA